MNDIELQTVGPCPLHADQNINDILVLEDAAFGVKEDRVPIIHGLNMTIKRSSLTMVIGKIGSGKSTLLKGLIGEIPTSAGSMRGRFEEAAYCDQQTWLINDSVQNNILGHSTLEAKWYETVVKCCALDRDFATFPLGDLTPVGSKGISLSGGQKARIVSILAKIIARD